MKKLISKHNFLYVVIVFFSIASALILSMFSLKLGAIIDVVVKKEGDLVDKILICVIVCFCWFLATLIYAKLKSHYIFNILKSIKLSIYSALDKRNLSDFYNETNEQYLNVFTKNIELLGTNYIGPRCDIAADLVSAVVSIAFIFYINWKLGFSFIAVTLVTIVLSQLPGVLMAKSLAVFTEKNAEYLRVINRFLKGFEQVKLLNIGKLFIKDYMKVDSDFEVSRRKYLFNTNLASILGMFFSFFAQLACMSIGIYFVMKGELTVGLLISAVNLLNGLFGPIQSLAQNKNLMGTVKEIEEEIDGLLSYENTDKVEFIQPVEKISINNMSMKFSDEKVIFDNYSVEFDKGKSYAIVGESGRGKSTLIKLILKYFNKDKYSGDILINDTDVSNITSDSLYKHIAYIQRSDFLIDGTVFDNIALKRYEKVPDEALFEHLKFSKEFLSKQIGDSDNDKISSGEKQRIDIARFLTNDYDVLIFDEPTSNLDAETSKMVFDLIFGIKNKIVIVITHTADKAILSSFDEVIRL